MMGLRLYCIHGVLLINYPLKQGLKPLDYCPSQYLQLSSN